MNYIPAFLLLISHIVNSATIQPLPTTTTTTVNSNQMPKCEQETQWNLMLYHNESGECFEVNKKGPCPNNLRIFQIPIDGIPSIYGECDCPSSDDPHEEDGEKVIFPNFYHKGHNRCYSLYTQGPCHKSKWVEWTSKNKVGCITNPCVNSTIENVVHVQGQCIAYGDNCGQTDEGMDETEKKIQFQTDDIPACVEVAVVLFSLSSGPNIHCPKGQRVDVTDQCTDLIEFE